MTDGSPVNRSWLLVFQPPVRAPVLPYVKYVHLPLGLLYGVELRHGEELHLVVPVGVLSLTNSLGMVGGGKDLLDPVTPAEASYLQGLAALTAPELGAVTRKAAPLEARTAV